MAAGRNVDFTQKEMEEMTGLDRTRFKRNLEKVCEMYKFDINNFKKEKDNPNSHFTFPPEIAELLALLVRNYDIHPKTLATIPCIDVNQLHNTVYFLSDFLFFLN